MFVLNKLSESESESIYLMMYMYIDCMGFSLRRNAAYFFQKKLLWMKTMHYPNTI